VNEIASFLFGIGIGGALAVGIFDLFNCKLLRRWSPWTPYQVKTTNALLDGRTTPPTRYGTEERTDFWQVRTCNRCGVEQRERVA
jgi:hypothetical protein